MTTLFSRPGKLRLSARAGSISSVNLYIATPGKTRASPMTAVAPAQHEWVLQFFASVIPLPAKKHPGQWKPDCMCHVGVLLRDVLTV